MREAKIETWRVALADGTTREVRAAQYEPGDAEAWVPDYRSHHKGAATMRQAVAKVAVANEWPIVEVLAPGDRTRADVLAENAASNRLLAGRGAPTREEWDRGDAWAWLYCAGHHRFYAVSNFSDVWNNYGGTWWGLDGDGKLVNVTLPTKETK